MSAKNKNQNKNIVGRHVGYHAAQIRVWTHRRPGGFSGASSQNPWGQNFVRLCGFQTPPTKMSCTTPHHNPKYEILQQKTICEVSLQFNSRPKNSFYQEGKGNLKFHGKGNWKLVFPGITGNGNYSRSPLTLPWFISRNIPTILCLLWLNERGCHKYNMKFLIKRCGMVGELGNSNLDFPGGLGPTRGVLRNSSKIHSPLPSPPLLILYSNKFLLSKKTHPALSWKLWPEIEFELGVYWFGNVKTRPDLPSRSNWFSETIFPVYWAISNLSSHPQIMIIESDVSFESGLKEKVSVINYEMTNY